MNHWHHQYVVRKYSPIPPYAAARWRNAVQGVYALAKQWRTKHGWAILRGAWWIDEIQEHEQTRAWWREEVQETHRMRRSGLAAKRRGVPWPINPDCTSGEHGECYGKFHVAHTPYLCHCRCHTKYPPTSRTCWCSEAKLREGGKRIWLIIPSSWIRWLHHWADYPCTSRWQAEMERENNTTSKF